MTEPSSGAGVDQDAAGKKPPLWRNIYFWGAIAGLVLVPAMRPLTRHVPDPPAVVAPMPSFERLDALGRPFRSVDLKDHVYLATFLGARCDAACTARVGSLVKLQQRCQRMGVKLWLVTLSIDSGPDDTLMLAKGLERSGARLSADARWILLGGRAENAAETARLIEAVNAASRARAGSAAERAVLVDGDGAIRGLWPIDDDGLYEVYHRAQHVMSLRRAWR